MTIHDLVNALHLQRMEMPPKMPEHLAMHFRAEDTDVLVSEDGETFVAINRVSGRFAGQRGESFISGFSDAELTDEQIALLRNPPTAD